MAYKKEEEKVEEKVEIVKETGVLPLTQEFGNGDLNILRDKINEILSRQK